MAKKVIGIYDTEAEVMDVVSKLENAGYAPEDITLIAKNSEQSSWLWNETNYDTPTTDDLSSYGKEDSFWEKVKDFFKGDLTEDNYNEAGGFVDRFTGYGLSDTEAEKYNDEVQLGRIIVLAPDDYNETLNTTGVTSDFNSDVERNTERKMKLREEELDIDKREVSAGEVEVKKEVHEDIQQVDVPVTREEIYVERKPVNEEDPFDADHRMEDETIRVPLKEEEIEVRKRPIVREEVEIGKKRVQDTEEVFDSVKREELDVDMENRRDKSQQSRELDTVFMEDEDQLEKRNRQSQRNWLLDDDEDNRL